MSNEPQFDMVGFPINSVILARSVGACEAPSAAELEQTLPMVRTDAGPIACLTVHGAYPEQHHDHVCVGDDGMFPILLSWRNLAYLAASIDELVKSWPTDDQTRYLAMRDQMAHAYRTAATNFKEKS